MRYNQWFPLLVLAFLAFSACGPEVPKKDFVVKGKLQGLGGKQVVLEQFDPEGNKGIDSVKAGEDGSFALSGMNPNKQLFLLKFPHNGQSLMCFPGNSEIELEGDVGQLSLAKWNNSWQSNAITKFQQERAALRQVFVRTSNLLRTISKEKDLEKWMEYEKAADAAMVDYRDFLMGFMDTVSEPRLAAFAGLHLNVEGNFNYLHNFLNSQRNSIGNDASFQYLDFNVQEHGKGFMGFQALDIVGKTIEGKDFNLDEFRGKPVYLYVWASYCGLSRAENQRLNAFHKAHPESPFQVLAFSIDKDEAAWRKAVAEDSISWATHMRGEFEWSSPQIRQFNIVSIPTSFLLDKQAIIRSKNAHGKDLLDSQDALVEKLMK